MLEGILGSTTKVRILRVLCAHPAREYTIRELALTLGLSLGSVYPALMQLVETRVVLARRVGRSRAVRLNALHPLSPVLRDLFRAEGSAFSSVARAFAQALPAAGLDSVVLFGSAARGEAGPRSDIDVLVVVDHTRRADRVRRTAAEFLDRFDANVVPLVLTRDEVDRRMRTADPLLLTIAEEGRRLRGRASWLGP